MTPTNLLGLTLIFTSGFIFTYYTFWVFFTPLLNKSSQILNYFPDRKYAIRIPAGLLLCGLSVVGIFTSYVMYKENQRKKIQNEKRN